MIINLIANTTTQAGLKIRAELDRDIYPVSLKITDAELGGLNLVSVALRSFIEVLSARCALRTAPGGYVAAGDRNGGPAVRPVVCNGRTSRAAKAAGPRLFQSGV